MNSESTSGVRTVKQSLRIYLAVFAGLWAVALAVVAIRSIVFHRGYPYDTLFFVPQLRYSDFTGFYPRSGIPFTYPAPLLICFLALLRLASEPLALYLILICIFTGIAGMVALRGITDSQSLRKPAAVIVIAGTFSFPLFFLLDRANLEGFVWMAASAGIFCFVRRRYAYAAVFLGLAASMKLFPGVLLLLFIAKRRYRDFALSVAAAAVFTIGSLWATGPSIARAFQGVALGADFLQRIEVFEFRPLNIGFDHSVFAYVKQVALRTVGDLARVNHLLPRIYLPYMAIVLLAFAVLYGVRLRHMPVLNQLLALSSLSITLPFVSYEYTLVHLAAPFIVLTLFLVTDVAAGRVFMDRSHILALLLPFAILFAPLTFLVDQGLGYGGQLKTLALIYLIGVACKIRLPSSIFGEVF